MKKLYRELVMSCTCFFIQFNVFGFYRERERRQSLILYFHYIFVGTGSGTYSTYLYKDILDLIIIIIIL